MELEALQSVHHDLKALHTALVAISPQQIRFLGQVAKKHRLDFPLLSDPGNQAASRFGIVFRLPEDLQNVYRKFGIDLPRYNGDDSWELPMPGRFIIAPDGRIRHADVDPDYTVRPDPASLIDEVRSSM